MHPAKLTTVAALFLAAGMAPAAAASCESSADYGAVFAPEDLATSVKALPPEALSGKSGKKLPARVMLGNLPPVAQQGTAAKPGEPGTCEAQSFGYGLGSYTAARDSSGKTKWSASLSQNNTSAAYLYTLIHSRTGAQCPTGSKGVDYLSQLTAYGAATRAQVPYQPNCQYLNNINISYAFPGMDRFRIGSYALIPVGGNDAAVGQIRSHLNAGQAVAFTGRVLCGYGLSPVFEKGVIYATDTIPDSGHGQLLVGYDDKIGKSNAKGAFLVQNSFGLGWPPKGSGSSAPAGKAYWSYNTFTTTQYLAAVAYPRADKPGKVRLTGSVLRAPSASLERGYQWTPEQGGGVYLILEHVFSTPVMLKEVTLTEPNGSSVKVTAAYGQHISAGYSYVKREDGKAFLPGTYQVKLHAAELDGMEVTYSGKVKVKKLKGAGLSAASMQGTTITGSTGAVATITAP